MNIYNNKTSSIGIIQIKLLLSHGTTCSIYNNMTNSIVDNSAQITLVSWEICGYHNLLIFYGYLVITIKQFHRFTSKHTSSCWSSGPIDYVIDTPKAIIPHQGGPVDYENMIV